jgi:predicted molibdopterin-dependent oxidoreductase YjgC
VQALVQGPLVEAADVVLPGAAWVEKDAAYTNMQGRLQAVGQAILPPGDALADWQVLVNVARSLGIVLGLDSVAAIRAAIEQLLPDEAAFAGLATLARARPVAAAHWLQASNPSERWKWDFMFQDLPPFKFLETHEPAERAGIIPLKKVD